MKWLAAGWRWYNFSGAWGLETLGELFIVAGWRTRARTSEYSVCGQRPKPLVVRQEKIRSFRFTKSPKRNLWCNKRTWLHQSLHEVVRLIGIKRAHACMPARQPVIKRPPFQNIRCFRFVKQIYLDMFWNGGSRWLHPWSIHRDLHVVCFGQLVSTRENAPRGHNNVHKHTDRRARGAIELADYVRTERRQLCMVDGH
jgi:hypothetical protein